MVQGATAAKKNNAARATPRIHGLFSLCLRQAAQNPEAGRKDTIELLVSAAIPQRTPKAIHGWGPLISSSCKVSQKISAKRRAARLVSHTQRAHQYMTVGRSAHAQADQIATL